MRVHHLNCATLVPPLSGTFRNEGFDHLVCHCLLVESDQGLVLVDTGFGTADLADPVNRLGRGLVTVVRPQFDPSLTAVAQVRRLGFAPEDVRHVLLTHLDPDHVGGLADFPNARAHVMMAEQEAAVLRSGSMEKLRYRPAHVESWSRWSLYVARGEPWNGFPVVRDLQGLPPDFLLVPLFGHTRGHCGVAVRSDSGWLLHAGDAYFHRDELAGRTAPPGLGLFERLDDVDHDARVANQARLAAAARDPQAAIRVFCSHDPVELAALQEGRPPPAPSAG